MQDIKIGSLVYRKSYNGDILFRVAGIKYTENDRRTFILKGVNVRLEADADEDDLEIMKEEKQIVWK